MKNENIQQEKFDALLDICGSHSEAARALSIHPAYYRYVRRTGKVSRFVDVMMDRVIESSMEEKK